MQASLLADISEPFESVLHSCNRTRMAFGFEAWKTLFVNGFHGGLAWHFYIGPYAPFVF